MSLLLSLQRKMFRRFMDGRPGPWGAMAVGIFGFRTLWRWARRNEEVVYRAELKPGETVTVAHTTDTEVSMRKARRADKRAARRARRAA